MKFICDDNLGKLAKFLRILGYDCLFFENILDRELLSLALKQDRLILTRDTKILKLKVAAKSLLIKSEDPYEQVKQVLSDLKLEPEKADFFSRCLVCNQVLERIEKEKIKDRVYPYVYQTQENFVICPKCKKIYWAGTHIEDMEKKLKRIVG
jgi:uncharacterized protein with PIN domain